MANYYVDISRPDDTGAGTSEATAKKTMAAGVALLASAGDQLNVKYNASSYTLTSALALNLSSAAAPFSIVGYQTTINDNGSKPTITSSTNSVNLFEFGGSTPRGWYFNNLKLTHTAGTRGSAFACPAALTYDVHVDNCVIDGCLYALFGYYASIYACSYAQFTNTEIKNCTSHGIYNNGSLEIINCYIHDNTGDGINLPDYGGPSPMSEVRIYNSVIKSNNIGVNDATNQATDSQAKNCKLSLRNCDILSNTSHGVYCSGASAQHVLNLVNCIVYGNGGYGVNLNHTATALFARNNAYGSNTSGARNNYSAESGAVTLSGDPFTNLSGGDFTLDNTAGEGAACRAAGYTNTLVGTGYPDIGAIQHQDSGGGGGGLACNPFGGFVL